MRKSKNSFHQTKTVSSIMSLLTVVTVFLNTGKSDPATPLLKSDTLKIETTCDDADAQEDKTGADAVKRTAPPPATCIVRLKPPLEHMADLKANYPCGITLPVPNLWNLPAGRSGVRTRKNFSRIALHSPNAAAVRVQVRGLHLPPGEVLRIYGEKEPAAQSEHRAPPEIYAEQGPFGDGDLWSNLVPGDTVYLEWTGSPGVPPFEPVALTHFWRSPFQKSHEHLDCHLDAALRPHQESRSVVRIVYQNEIGPGVCTGVLIATPTKDGAPLVVTAYHAIPTDAVARTVQAFWLYRNQSPMKVCFSPTGARVVAVERGKDQTLLEILGVLPRGLCYSGWTTETPPGGTEVVAWHHPGGGTPLTAPMRSVLRVSFGVTSGESATCLSLPHAEPGFVVSWKAGATASGSSGSGVWWERDGRRHLIGLLSCGPASCRSPENENYDVYGRSGDFLRRATAEFAQEKNTMKDDGGNLTVVVKQARDQWIPVTLPARGKVRIHAAAPCVFGAVGLELHRAAAEHNAIESDGSLTTERFVTPNGETLVCVNHGPEMNVVARVFLRNDTRAVCRLTVTNETQEKSNIPRTSGAASKNIRENMRVECANGKTSSNFRSQPRVTHVK